VDTVAKGRTGLREFQELGAIKERGSGGTGGLRAEHSERLAGDALPTGEPATVATRSEKGPLARWGSLGEGN